jgi:DNA-binding MarR family transcriptional regulator
MLFRIISLLIERWASSVKTQCGLSFNESRILILLELYGALGLGDVARKLYIAPSNVTVLCSRLRELGLLETVLDDEDARRKRCRCTDKGLRFSRELLSVLRKTTRDSYSGYSDASVIAFNAQHMRMYGELERVMQIEHLFNQYK